MSAEGSARVVLTALGANLGVAAAKFVAAGITGSASMLAEGVHSVADSGNQLLLLIGGRRARQAPSALHPFGYARARYVYAFLVAVVLFVLGGLYALYEGYHKIVDPHPLTSPLVAMAVLVVAAVLEGYALRTAVREANRTRGTRSWFHFVVRAVSAHAAGAEIAATIDDAEVRVRKALPSARLIYLEPDIYRSEPAPR